MTDPFNPDALQALHTPAPLPVEVPPADSGINEAVARLQSEIGRALVGQNQVVHEVLVALLAGGHVLIEGVPGLGKTLLVKALARTFQGDSRRIQFTPDLMPADITGHALYNTRTQEFEIRRGPVFTNFLLADEVNRSPAKTQAALLEVMQEKQVTIEGETSPVPSPFMVFATQNPIEQEGTYPLPEAQLDRFLLKILIGYPSEAEEIALAERVTSGRTGDALDVSAVSPFLSAGDVTVLQEAASRVHMDPRVLQYAVRIARRTRDMNGIAIGAGPRGAIALIRAGRAAALLDGRDFALPDDIKGIALAALRHRVRLAPEMEIEGVSTDQILTRILTEIEAPRL